MNTQLDSPESTRLDAGGCSFEQEIQRLRASRYHFQGQTKSSFRIAFSMLNIYLRTVAILAGLQAARFMARSFR